MSRDAGQVITACGLVPPSSLGRVMMHEHLHADCYDWENDRLIVEERPIPAERRELLMKEAVPYLNKCAECGCHAYVDASRAAGMHIIVCTGFYREVEDGAYWVKRPQDRIWPFVADL
jgi:predicted metal-dependent phosphotriesterase family hydrolase